MRRGSISNRITPLIAIPCGITIICGINLPFGRLSPCLRQVTHVLLTRPPLDSSRRNYLARLACVRHAASVRPEPGSNSQFKRIWSHSSQSPAPHSLLLTYSNLLSPIHVTEWSHSCTECALTFVKGLAFTKLLYWFCLQVSLNFHWVLLEFFTLFNFQRSCCQRFIGSLPSDSFYILSFKLQSVNTF
jgi:hypothetical protein